MSANKPLFTIVIFAWRPKMLARSLNALLNQTYRNIEIILVDNFPAQDNVEIGKQISAMVDDFASKDSRIRVLRVARVKYELKDILKNFYDCCRTALAESKGEYFIFQNDDDFMALDYVEKLVALFLENPKCTSATGLTICVNSEGTSLETRSPRLYNYRPRHMPGHALAINYARSGGMFSSPGVSVFAFKKKNYLELGGHHESSDVSQMYGIIAFGDTAFDDSAYFYWVRHENQFNLELMNKAWFGIDVFLNLIRDWKLAERWEPYGKDLADEVISAIRRQTLVTPAHWFARHFYQLNISACCSIIKQLWRHPAFWMALPAQLWNYNPILYNKTRYLKLAFEKLGLRVPFKILFKIFPSLPDKSIHFMRLSKKINQR